MKFIASAVFALLPFLVLASPTPEAPVPIAVANIGADVSPAPRSTRLLARSNTPCKIINTDYYAHCRSGPGISKSVTHYVFFDTEYEFQCFDISTCVNGNCTWDKLIWDGGECWVSGFFTDSRCSMARLGNC